MEHPSPQWLERILARLDSLELAVSELSHAVGALQRAPMTPRPLTTDEAARYCGFGSQNGFRDWARKWHVRACAHGRWPLHRLNAGLEREQVQGGKKREG